MKKYDWENMTWREIDVAIHREIFEAPIYRTDKDFFYVIDTEDSGIHKLKPVPHYSRNINDTIKLVDELNKKYFIRLFSTTLHSGKNGYVMSIAGYYADQIIAKGEDKSMAGAILKCVIEFINDKYAEEMG